MLQYSFLFISKEIIIFMTSCKLVIGNYKGLYNANIWMLYGVFLATVPGFLRSGHIYVMVYMSYIHAMSTTEQK